MKKRGNIANKQKGGSASEAKYHKRYIKLLSQAKSPKLTKDLIKDAPISILKLISNAAIHASHGQVHLSKPETELFRKKKAVLGSLVNKAVPVPKKRSVLLQKGGAAFPLIPILLSTVLSSIGPLLFHK